MIQVAGQAVALTLPAYPNPFLNELRMALPANWQGKEVKIELFTAGGQLVKTKRVTSSSQTEMIGTGGLGSGLYMIRITTGTEKAQYKVIKN